MAIPHLTEEQVRTWSLEEKDRWWLTNVFRGNMPQLTLRAGLTGFCLGGILSATNLYVGAKTGWTLGVGLTSVILAFAMFKVMTQLGAREFSILENNCMQSTATAAGYMTGPLISGIAAYMWVTGEILPWWQIMAFNVVLSLLGVLVAFPMKRRFINDEQQSFPEGRAVGVVLDALYTSSAAVGVFKAKALAAAALVAGGVKILTSENITALVQQKWLGMERAYHLPERLDAWYYWMAGKGWVPIPRLAGVPVQNLGLYPSMELAMVGAGGLMGIRAATSMMIGMLLNFVVIVPWMVSIGEILPKPGQAVVDINRIWALNTWALWWGIAIMVTAALTGLFAKPKLIVGALTGIFGRRGPRSDVLRHVELPLWISFLGVPIIGAVGVWMAHEWFEVRWVWGALAIPLIIVLTLIAANSTGLTGITPTGSLSKIPQFLFGAADPKMPATNLMTALMCTEVASNASNLLMDIKPGYMLGAKPRQQAIGHCIGIVAGALVSTPLYFALFLSGRKEGQPIMERMMDQFGFPSAVQWKGISDLISAGFSSLPVTAQWSMGIAAAAGLAMEVVRIRSRGAFPLSPLAIGLGVVIPPDSTIAMFAGAIFFWWMHRIYQRREGSFGHRLWIQTHEPICAGLIAGFALMGITDILVRVFLL